MAPPVSDDPDLCLYSGGFFPDSDKEKLGRFHALLAARRKSVDGLKEAKVTFQKMKFIDDRIPRLAGRLFARNFPETLGDTERLKWRDFCAGRIQLPAREGAAELADYSRLVETELADPDLSAPKRAIVHSLLEWKHYIEEEVLSWGG